MHQQIIPKIAAVLAGNRCTILSLLTAFVYIMSLTTHRLFPDLMGLRSACPRVPAQLVQRAHNLCLMHNVCVWTFEHNLCAGRR